MPRRSSQVHLAAAYQLLASYLVWDLRDLLSSGTLGIGAPRERLKQLIEMLDTATRAGEPAYPAAAGARSRRGTARGERSERLASLNNDRELLELVSVAHDDKDLGETSEWAREASVILTHIRDNQWSKPDHDGEEFIEKQVQPFLGRLQRIDQIDSYRPGNRAGMTRR
jgi:hypothetical protein